MRITFGNVTVKRLEYERLVAERRNLNANLQIRPLTAKHASYRVVFSLFSLNFRNSRLIFCRKTNIIVRHVKIYTISYSQVHLVYTK
jgi:hypothetical protein